MKVEISITDYLTNDEIKEICKDHLRSALSEKCDVERVLSNLAYDVKHGILDMTLTQEHKDTIKTNLEKILTDISAWDVFRKPSAWDKQPSLAFTYLQQAVAENKNQLMDSVVKTLREFNYEEYLQSDCIGILESSIIKAIKGN